MTHPLITPLLSVRAFYPMPRDIKNHVGNAKFLLELSKLDQENIHLKIEEWKKIIKEKIIFYMMIPNLSGTYMGKSGCKEQLVSE